MPALTQGIRVHQIPRAKGRFLFEPVEGTLFLTPPFPTSDFQISPFEAIGFRALSPKPGIWFISSLLPELPMHFIELGPRCSLPGELKSPLLGAHDTVSDGSAHIGQLPLFSLSLHLYLLPSQQWKTGVHMSLYQ